MISSSTIEIDLDADVRGHARFGVLAFGVDLADEALPEVQRGDQSLLNFFSMA